MKLVALAAVALHGLASKVQPQLLELDGGKVEAVGLHLRGHSAKVQDPTVTTLDSEIYPVAPQDKLAPGVEAAAAESPPGSALPRYERKEEKAPSAFPETIIKASRALRGQHLECHDSPHDWQDSNGNNCYQYERGEWCSTSGAGTGWNQSWGNFQEWSNSMAKNGPQNVCCVCGGGVKFLASQPRLNRRLQAPQDSFRGAVAPADELPQEFMESVPVTAPFDEIPAKFAHYLTSVDTQRRQPDVMGLSARFYSVKPTDECNGPAPVSSSIDRALDYRFGFVGFPRFLQVAKHAEGSFFYGKWTGTINILEKGMYVFDLDLGFDTMSSIKIDGKEMLTHGQCKASKEAFSCAQKRCLWLDGACVPPTGAAPAPAPAPLAALAASPALEWPRLVPERRSDVMSPWHDASLALLQAPSPAASPAPDVAAPIPAAAPAAKAPAPALAVPAPAPALAVPAPAPALAVPAPAPASAAPAPAPVSAAPAPVPIPAPPAFEAEGRPGEMFLSAGGHCVEVLVRADPNSRSLQLLYNGPDTGHVKTVVPGQVLFCDPVVPACVSPELSSCKSSRCGGDAMAPAAAPMAAAVAMTSPSRGGSPRIPPGWSVPTMMEAVAK